MAETRTLSSSPSLTLLRTEGQLRNKIKELHEKRAAGLMSEIAQLQKEKSISNSQIKNLGSIITDLRKENAFMKQKEKEFVAKIQSLERLLLEEKLIVENYKAKYKSLDKKNKELLKKLDNRRSTELSTGLSPLKGGDRSSSLSNLSQMNIENQQPSLLSVSQHSENSPMSSPASSPSQSPSVIHRRYRLATIQTLEQETQTEEIASKVPEYSPKSEEKISKPFLEILASAKDDILMLQQHKKNLQKQLRKHTLDKKINEEEITVLKSRIQVQKEEADILKENLSLFTDWVQDKLSILDEDLDMCKLIYSLHNSLSKENEVVNEMQSKLSISESTLQEERTTNKRLMESLEENEQIIQQLQSENSDLKEQLMNNQATLSKINELRIHARNQSIPSPLTRHTTKHTTPHGNI